MALTIEEEIFVSAGLLTPNYDPETELEEGDEHLTPAEQKEDLKDAREEFLQVLGRASKINWEGAQAIEVGQDMPTDKGLRVRAIFGSVRKSRHEEGDKLIDGLPFAYSVGDMRIYAEPKQSLPGDNFKRFTINRLSPASVHEPLTRDNYVDEIAAEIRFQLREECPHCSKAIEHDEAETSGACPHCDQDLMGEEGDEGAEETPATPGTPEAPNPSSSTAQA